MIVSRNGNEFTILEHQKATAVWQQSGSKNPDKDRNRHHVEAIFDKYNVPSEFQDDIQLNAESSQIFPQITERKS